MFRRLSGFKPATRRNNSAVETLNFAQATFLVKRERTTVHCLYIPTMKQHLGIHFTLFSTLHNIYNNVVSAIKRFFIVIVTNNSHNFFSYHHETHKRTSLGKHPSAVRTCTSYTCIFNDGYQTNSITEFTEYVYLPPLSLEVCLHMSHLKT
jgi:hypothetical protein